jgi:hypothetical protein
MIRTAKEIILENIINYQKIYSLYKNDKCNNKDIENMTGIKIDMIKNSLESMEE